MKLIPGFLLVSSILICLRLPAIAQISAKQCNETIKYENRNQSDPKPLVINEAIGDVTVQGGKPVNDLGPASGACLGIFTEKEHKLVATATTDREGRFKFNSVTPGEYRIVARYETFCIANIPLIITAKASPKHKRLTLHMRPVSLDECSYAEVN